MATIIKSGTNEPRASAADLARADFRFEDFESRAEQYLDRIRSEAAKILEAARQQATEIHRAAEAAGRQAAAEAAEKQVDEKIARQMERVMPALEEAIRGIEDSRHDWIRNWEQGTVQLASAIARRIVQREIKLDPELPLTWIAEALSLAAGNGTVRLHLHPADAASLGASIDQVLTEIGKLGGCEVIQDERIAPGGCRVTTEFGEIDEQLDTQLARIQEELLGGGS